MTSSSPENRDMHVLNQEVSIIESTGEYENLSFGIKSKDFLSFKFGKR